MYFVQKIGCSFVNYALKWLIDNMIKSAFSKILHQLGTEFIDTFLYEYSKKVFYNKEEYYTQDEKYQERRFFCKASLVIYESKFAAFGEEVSVYGQH